MINLNNVTYANSADTDYDPMEDFYLHQIFPESVVEFFMDSRYGFNESFLTFLSDESGLSGKTVWSIANNIRDKRYLESMKDLVEKIIDRLDVSDRAEILAETFSEKVDRLIIRSRHNDQVKKIADATYAFVEQIFDDNGMNRPDFFGGFVS